MESLDQSLPVIEDGDHPLLEPPLPAYTDLTMRRAFATWLHCGHKTKFRLMCDYYHRLEAMEDKLPAKERAQSRYLEMNLLVKRPPRSVYQMQMFPDLYSNSHIQSQHIAYLQAMTNEKCIFKLEGFCDIAEKDIASSKERQATCKKIRNYCKTKALPLRIFVKEFQEYISKCALQRNFCTLTNYINHKSIQSEIQIIKNIPNTFSFLEEEEENSLSTVKVINKEKTTSFKEHINKNENINKLNKSTAEFFESFYNGHMKKDKNVNCWIFDNNNVMNNCKLASRSAENLKHTEVSKRVDGWSLLKALMARSETTKLSTYEECKI